MDLESQIEYMKKMMEMAYLAPQNVSEFRFHYEMLKEIYESLARLKDLED